MLLADRDENINLLSLAIAIWNKNLDLMTVSTSLFVGTLISGFLKLTEGGPNGRYSTKTIFAHWHCCSSFSACVYPLRNLDLSDFFPFRTIHSINFPSVFPPLWPLVCVLGVLKFISFLVQCSFVSSSSFDQRFSISKCNSKHIPFRDSLCHY